MFFLKTEKRVRRAWIFRIGCFYNDFKNQVLKLMPPLITDEKGLNAGLDILKECLILELSKGDIIK